MKHLVLCGCLLVSGVAHAEVDPRTALVLDRDEELTDKKTQWLAEKSARAEEPRQAVTPPVKPDHPLSLHNLWTDEVVTISSTLPEDDAQLVFDRITRDHFTGVAFAMAPPLLGLVRRTATAFHTPLVEIVSGYRAPKYQLMLRKKGHEVARDSEHPKGEAVDFRLPNIATTALLAFVRRQHLGGVGFYPVSRFVHADVGPMRYWKGH